MLSAADLLSELYTLAHSLEETAFLCRHHLEASTQSHSHQEADWQGSEEYCRMLERTTRHKSAVLALTQASCMTSGLIELSEMERLESLLEKHQDVSALLDRLIAQTNDGKVLEQLRLIFIDTLEDWDIVARHIEQLQAPHSEQRRKVRMRTLGDLVITDNASDRCLKGRCLDVSPEGLSALVNAELPVGARYELEFNIMGARKTAKANGEVRWCRPRASGDIWRVGFQLQV
jgi:hypothetical protein